MSVILSALDEGNKTKTSINLKLNHSIKIYTEHAYLKSIPFFLNDAFKV